MYSKWNYINLGNVHIVKSKITKANKSMKKQKKKIQRKQNKSNLTL